MIGGDGVSKAAIIILAKVLARELGPFGIRLNAIAPELIETRFSEAVWTNEDILGQYASCYVTGHTIVLDGDTLA